MPSDFWDMTYAEWGLVADGYIKRTSRAHDERMSQAWHTAALVRMRKDFPPLSDLLHGEKAEAKEQSIDSLIATAKVWTVALGGEVVEHE